MGGFRVPIMSATIIEPFPFGVPHTTTSNGCCEVTIPHGKWWLYHAIMMTSSNGNIFRVTGPLCGEFPTKRPVTRGVDVFFDLRFNKQSWGWWFVTPSCSLWRHCNDIIDISVLALFFLYRFAGWLHGMEAISALLAFFRGTHQWPIVSLAKSQRDGVVIFSLTLVWTSCWTNSRVKWIPLKQLPSSL